MKLLIAIIILLLLLVTMIYTLCKASSMDDRARERQARSWDDDDYFEVDKPKWLDK